MLWYFFVLAWCVVCIIPMFHISWLFYQIIYYLNFRIVSCLNFFQFVHALVYFILRTLTMKLNVAFISCYIVVACRSYWFCIPIGVDFVFIPVQNVISKYGGVFSFSFSIVNCSFFMVTIMTSTSFSMITNSYVVIFLVNRNVDKNQIRNSSANPEKK